MDYTALHKFDKFEVGLGGTLSVQMTNDTVHGITVPAVAGVNGYGNRAQNFTIGPVVSYDLGTANIAANYNRSIEARNVPAGNNFWLRFDAPLVK
jgi:hypothetical protein